jgi:hypothetical protein
MKYITITLLLLFCSFAKAQDPGTVVEVKIMKAGKLIEGNPLERYNATLTIFNQHHSAKEKPLMFERVKDHFHSFEWNPYYGEIFELTISHSSDKMVIHFKADTDTLKNKMIANMHFILEIPFQTGYYEVTDFVNIKGGSEYIIKKEHQWLNLTADKRKLVVGGK